MEKINKLLQYSDSVDDTEVPAVAASSAFHIAWQSSGVYCDAGAAATDAWLDSARTCPYTDKVTNPYIVFLHYLNLVLWADD